MKKIYMVYKRGKEMGNIFKELREKHRISQAELSGRTGISQQALSHIEVTGKYPNSDNLLKIAEFYDVSTDYLLGKEKNDILNLYSDMTAEEKLAFVKYGEYLISSRRQ